MENLIIHVGLGKTGTSAIQTALFKNRNKLENCGTYICDCHLLTESSSEHGFETADHFWECMFSKEAIADRLIKVFKQNSSKFSHYETVIWSNEGLAMRWEKLAPFVIEMTKTTKVKIVLYFRNQADWLVSAYLQWAIKDKQNHGTIWDWSTFVADKKLEMNYVNTVRAWAMAVNGAAILPRSYDEKSNVLEDFCEVAGLDPRILDKLERVYETPEYTSLSLFKILNNQYSEPKSPEPLLHLLHRAGVLDRDLHSVDPCPVDVSEQDLDELEAKYACLNDDLAVEYGVKFKPRHDLKIKRRDVSSAVNTDIISALLMINVYLYMRVEDLQLVIDKLNRDRD